MKRLFLIICLVASIATAHAWNNTLNEAVLLLARKHMSPTAIAEYNNIAALHGSINHGWAKNKTARVALDADLRSTTTSETDIAVRIEQAAELLRKRAEHSDAEVYTALQTIVMLMPDLHNISLVTIEGVEHSHNDFKIFWVSGKVGSKRFEKRGTILWSKLWNNLYYEFHSGWTADYYAYDLNLHFKDEREAWMKGTVREWAKMMGERALPMYEWAKPDYVMSGTQRLDLEEEHLTSLAQAGFRLAALLNNVFK